MLNLQNYQTIKVNNSKQREVQAEPSSQTSRRKKLIPNIDNTQQMKQQRHYSRSPIMSHNNGFNFQYPNQDFNSNSQAVYNQSQQKTITQMGYQANPGQHKAFYHKRSLSPTIVQPSLSPTYFTQNINQHGNYNNYQGPLTQSYNQPIFQNQLIEDTDNGQAMYGNQMTGYTNRNQQQNHKRITQSVDFNMVGGFQKHLFQDQNYQEMKPNTQQQQQKVMKDYKRDLSPIWGPQQYNNNNGMRDQMMDAYNSLPMQHQLEYAEDQVQSDIILTESDVSHQSSFYDIPEERKLKYNQIQQPYPMQRLSDKELMMYQQQQQQQQQQVNNPFNSLLKQFQYQQSTQPPQQPIYQQQYTIPQSQTAKVSPRFNLYQNQQQKNIKPIQPNKVNSELQQKPRMNKEVEQYKPQVNYSKYQEVQLNQSSKQTLSQQSLEMQSSQTQLKIEKNLKSQQSTEENQASLTSRHTEKQLVVTVDPKDQIDTLILQRSLDKVSQENVKLKTELEAFKILCKSLLKQNKSLKTVFNEQKHHQQQKLLYLAKIKQLEHENNTLKIQNYKILDKFQHTISFIQDYANHEVDEDQDDDYGMIEQIYEENAKLRDLLMIQSDMETLALTQQSIENEELKVQEATYDKDLQSNSDWSNDSSQVKDMIEKASKQIKDKAKKRKEEEKANEVQQNVTLDGKPEKFPFKNIKPKKAFLLGSPGNDDTAASSDDSGDGNVMMCSPEQQNQDS